MALNWNAEHAMVSLRHFYIQASDIRNTEEGNNSILPILNIFFWCSSFLENLLPSKVCAYKGNLVIRLAPWNERHLPNTSVDSNIGIQWTHVYMIPWKLTLLQGRLPSVMFTAKTNTAFKLESIKRPRKHWSTCLNFHSNKYKPM